MNSSFVSLFHHRVILTKAIVMFIRTLLLFIHWHTLYSLCSVSVLQLTFLSNKFIIRNKREKEEEKRNNEWTIVSKHPPEVRYIVSFPDFARRMVDRGNSSTIH